MTGSPGQVTIERLETFTNLGLQSQPGILENGTKFLIAYGIRLDEEGIGIASFGVEGPDLLSLSRIRLETRGNGIGGQAMTCLLREAVTVLPIDFQPINKVRTTLRTVPAIEAVEGLELPDGWDRVYKIAGNENADLEQAQGRIANHGCVDLVISR